MTIGVENPSSGENLHDLFVEVFNMRENLGKVMDGVHEAAGMATSELRVAYTILVSGDVTVPEVAEKLNVSRQFVQKVCDNLVWEGLLQYEENPRHKRSKLVGVTPFGRKKLEEVRSREAALIARFFRGMQLEPVREATDTLREINARLGRHAAEASMTDGDDSGQK